MRQPSPRPASRDRATRLTIKDVLIIAAVWFAAAATGASLIVSALVLLGYL